MLLLLLLLLSSSLFLFFLLLKTNDIYCLVIQNIENEKMLNPLPVQGFADDIAIVTDDKRSLHEMINVSEPIMQRINLDVKASKCAVLSGRRSGNNWCTGQNDKKPNIAIRNKNIKILKSNES